MPENSSGYTPDVPLLKPVDVDAEVLSNARLSSEYNVVSLSAPVIASHSRPGQFVMVKCGLQSEPLLRRPFSIFEILHDPQRNISGLSLLNKTVGIVTEMLFNLEPGDRLRCLGPLGQPFSVVNAPTEAWMGAGGVGLAPFLTLAETLKSNKVKTTLFYGGRSVDDLYYLERFKKLGVRLVLTTEDGTQGEKGLITVPLARKLENMSASCQLQLYACGPTGMMHEVATLGQSYGRKSEVSLEPLMGCGLGGCYSCVVPIKNADNNHFIRSCLEGPVFSGDRIAWDKLT